MRRSSARLPLEYDSTRAIWAVLTGRFSGRFRGKNRTYKYNASTLTHFIFRGVAARVWISSGNAGTLFRLDDPDAKEA